MLTETASVMQSVILMEPFKNAAALRFVELGLGGVQKGRPANARRSRPLLNYGSNITTRAFMELPALINRAGLSISLTRSRIRIRSTAVFARKNCST